MKPHWLQQCYTSMSKARVKQMFLAEIIEGRKRNLCRLYSPQPQKAHTAHKKPMQKHHHPSHQTPTSAIRNSTGMTNPQSKDTSSEYFKLSLNAFMLLLGGIWPHYKLNQLGFFWWDWFQARLLPCLTMQPCARWCQCKRGGEHTVQN